MIVLAFDPGKTIGFAAVSFYSSHPDVIDSSSESDLVYWRDELPKLPKRNQDATLVVAVETNETYATRERNINPVPLINAARIGGEIAGFARGLGLRVVEASALEWRRAIVGKRNASDAEIKTALSRLVDLPRTNAHVRDSIGLALYAYRKILLESRTSRRRLSK